MHTEPTTNPPTGRRRQTEAKRTAILDAAEELFVTSGYELTSVDAIAARASVSKRTVYDHFGDKRSLYRAVLGRVDDALLVNITTAVDEELTDDRDLTEALLAFVRRLLTDVIPSSNYANFRHLISKATAAPQLPERSHEEPEQVLERRFARYAADGVLTITDPRRAVQHFLTLTMRLVLDELDRAPTGCDTDAEVQSIVTDGVSTFLRAYR